jgi:GrpB-like predicted nucleotidyltransferase (UPF0157 family)
VAGEDHGRRIRGEEKIEIEPYDPRWARDFDDERARIAAALGGLAIRIEHNGSTSVPGLAAKPIIDIQIAVASLQPLDAYVRPLATLGYSHAPHEDDSFCPFFHRPAAWPHTHHVHLVAAGGPEERRTLAFRDYLRDHPASAREYEALKWALTAELTLDGAAAREAYAEAKTSFIERVIGLALAQGYGCHT